CSRFMTRSRLLLLVAGAVVLLLVLGVVLVFSSSFQTWALRRAITAQPGLEATIGSVSAGLNRLELTDVRFAHAGAVLTLPNVEVDVPLWAAAWDDRVRVSRLLARDWTLTLADAATPSVPPPPTGAPRPSKRDPAAGETRPAAPVADPADPAASAAR